MLRKGFVFILLLTLTIPVVHAQDTSANLLEITLYSDGTAKTDYTLESDPTKVRVNVELFGAPFTNLIIRDEDDNPLSYSIEGNNITINSIGALELRIYYLTSSLTAKYGSLWELNITAPTTTRIILPVGASIVDFLTFPTNIGVSGGKTYIEFTSGDLSLYYILGLPSITIEANAAYEAAESYIYEKITEGYILDEAILILDQSQIQSSQGNYLEAKKIAETALQQAEYIIYEAQAAEESISIALSAIIQAESEHRISNLDAARTTHNSSIELFNTGYYEEAQNVANQAYQLALRSESTRNGNLSHYILIIIAFLALGAFFYYQRNKKFKPLNEDFQQNTIHIDIDKIFKEHDLRLEDREVVRYIAETNSEVFASEIRDRFEMPRSTTWRLIQRLKEMGIIEEVIVGNQSLLRIIERYHKEVE